MTPSPIALNDTAAQQTFAGNLFTIKTHAADRDHSPWEPHRALAHEVRSPLTNINLSLKMLQTQVNDEEVQEYLDIIQRSSDRISQMINDFLEPGKAQDRISEKYAIHQLIHEVLAVTKDRLALKRIKVQLDLCPDQPRILLNPHEIIICLTNIIINAIDAMESNSGNLRIITRARAELFFLHISDNGCGMNKKNLSRIFAPYFSNKAGGMGLGLSTTHHLLMSNQVGIKVNSELGVGTRFSLLFDTASA